MRQKQKDRFWINGWVPLVRIALGFLLVWRGLAFIQETSQLQTFLERTAAGELPILANILAGTVGIVTLLSGIFIAVGLFTRPIAILQIMMVGAGIIFLSVMSVDRSPEDMLSISIVLVLLAIYSVKGSGRISFDEELEAAANNFNTPKNEAS